jgi:hypothetical protein
MYVPYCWKSDRLHSSSSDSSWKDFILFVVRKSLKCFRALALPETVLGACPTVPLRRYSKPSPRPSIIVGALLDFDCITENSNSVVYSQEDGAQSSVDVDCLRFEVDAHPLTRKGSVAKIVTDRGIPSKVRNQRHLLEKNYHLFHMIDGRRRRLNIRGKYEADAFLLTTFLTRSPCCIELLCTECSKGNTWVLHVGGAEDCPAHSQQPAQQVESEQALSQREMTGSDLNRNEQEQWCECEGHKEEADPLLGAHMGLRKARRSV